MDNRPCLWALALLTATLNVSAQTEPAAYWRFDENSGGIAADSAHPGKLVYNPDTGQYQQSYGRYPATLTGTAWVGGQFGSALRFNGQAKAVTPPIALAKAFSISAWVAPTSEAVQQPAAYMRIAETAYDTAFFLGTDMSGTKYKLIVNAGYGSTGGCSDAFGCVSGGKPIGNKWQLVTGTYDGTTARLYVDGVQVAADAAAGRESTNMPLSIGAYSYYPNAGYDWRGDIDDVRLYDRALTALEVAELYNQAAGARLPIVQISAMTCKELTFLDHSTRALTCAMKSANNLAWRGSVQVKFEVPQRPEQPPANYAWPVLMERRGIWALTAIGIYDRPEATPRVLGADFYGRGANGIWDNHPQCEPNCPAVAYQKLDYPCPEAVPCMSGLYPAPLAVTDFRCQIDPVDNITRSVTCGVAANQNNYGGAIKINFDNGTSEQQRVTITQPMINGSLVYWGVAAVGTDNQQPITNIEFWSDSPIANWTPATTTAYPPPTKQKNSFHQWLCHVFRFCK